MIITRAMPTQQTAITGVSRRITAGQEIKAELCRGPDPAVHGRGLGTDAVRTMARHLIVDHGHHRLEIDPAADNAAAIRCYTKVGFRPVGIRRRSERGNDGRWHDGLLMDLLADEFSPADNDTAGEATAGGAG